MTGKVCLQPGLAKRAENFADISARAGEFTPQPISRVDMDRAAMQGTPSLSAGARCLLGFYLSHLSALEIEQGKTGVWPGAWNASTALGVSESTIRRQKAELEQKGFILRKYDRRNRPLENDAIDLAPFLAQVADIIAEINARLDARRESFAGQRAPDASTARANMTAQVRNNERLNSPPESLDSCFIFSGFEEEGQGHTDINTNAITEAKRAFEDAKIVNQAIRLSPKLKAAIASEGEALSASEAARRIWQALPKLFPKAGDRSISHTFLWCAQRHGAGAFTRLAVALEDPKIKNPQKYFGWLATTADDVDLTAHLERIQHKPAPEKPAATVLDVPGDSFGDEVAREIAGLIGVPKYNSWLARKNTRYAQSREGLVIETVSSVCLDRLNNHMSAQLRVAATRLGFNRVIIRMAG